MGVFKKNLGVLYLDDNNVVQFGFSRPYTNSFSFDYIMVSGYHDNFILGENISWDNQDRNGVGELIYFNSVGIDSGSMVLKLERGALPFSNDNLLGATSGGKIYINGEITEGEHLVPLTTTGSDTLLQNIIIRLFTDTGSNGFEPTFGGNLYYTIGKGYVPGQEESIRGDFALAFETVETQIKEEQLLEPDLPDIERLDALLLKSVEYNEQTWNIIVQVRTANKSLITFTIVE